MRSPNATEESRENPKARCLAQNQGTWLTQRGFHRAGSVLLRRRAPARAALTRERCERASVVAAAFCHLRFGLWAMPLTGASGGFLQGGHTGIPHLLLREPYS